jgi:hypothetical protein
MIEKNTAHAAMATGMIDSNKGRFAAWRGKMRKDIRKGTSHTRKPNIAILEYLFTAVPQ